MIVGDEDLAKQDSVTGFADLDVEFRIVVVGAGEGGFRRRIEFFILDAENDLCRYPWAVLDTSVSEFHTYPPIYCFRRVSGRPTTLS